MALVRLARGTVKVRSDEPLFGVAAWTIMSTRIPASAIGVLNYS